MNSNDQLQSGNSHCIEFQLPTEKKTNFQTEGGSPFCFDFVGGLVTAQPYITDLISFSLILELLHRRSGTG